MRFSIVIPTYGRPARLQECLRAITDLDYNFDAFEVMVVDDGGHGETRDVVAQFDQLFQIRYIPHATRTGPARARNAGAAASRGTWLVFLDDDCTVLPGWLRGFDEVLAREVPGTAIGGRVINAVEDNIFAAASQSVMEFLYEWYNATADDARFFATNNLLCPRADFLAIGGFDERFSRAAAEDRDFCDRWRESGRRLVNADRAIVSHYHRLTLASFVAQHFGYGRGAVDLHLGRDRRGVDRPRMEPLTFYAGLITYPMRKHSGSRAALLATLAAATQVAYASGYYLERLLRLLKPGEVGTLSPAEPPAVPLPPSAVAERSIVTQVHVEQFSALGSLPPEPDRAPDRDARNARP